MSRGRGKIDLNSSGSSRVRREQHHAVSQARRLADVVRHENDRLLPRLPDLLDVAVELFARQRVQRRKRLVHQQHPRIRRQRPRQRDALFHAAGKLVDIGSAQIAPIHQLK